MVLVNNITNGRIQLAVDASNASFTEFLAARVPRNGTVLLDLPTPNEYMVETQAHLASFQKRPDIYVGYLRPGEDASGTSVTP